MPFIGVGSAAQHLAEAIAEEGLTDEVPDPIENEPRRAFVAIDLVELDGEPLHDIPFMERRRLLDVGGRRERSRPGQPGGARARSRTG